MVAAYRRTYSLSLLAWSEGWQPPGSARSLHPSYEPNDYSIVNVDHAFVKICLWYCNF